MNKEEFIARRGAAAWEKKNQQTRDWRIQHPNEIKVYSNGYYAAHREEGIAKTKAWQANNPEKAEAIHREQNHKGGKHYEKMLIYQRTGLQGERHKIRRRHAFYYQAIKQATPNSVLHHEWIPGTAKYRGVALVEKEAHRRGIIVVIIVLEGQITLFTEKEIAEQALSF